MKTYGLIGYPLKNSFSAEYFNTKFSSLGIDAIYKNFPLQHIADLKLLLAEQPDLAGLNVTIPYKESIIPYLDKLDDSAALVGAVNTIKFEHNELIGYNTDVYGFKQSILPLLKPWHQNALVLGTGGAAKAVVFVLDNLGIKKTMVSRKAEAGLLYEETDKPIIRSHQVIINCTPLGMYPHHNTFPPIPYQYITAKHLAYDLVYLPEKTCFLQYAEQHGAIIKNGLQMLQMQAEKAWEIWNDQ